jgi:hypothetical protein
MSSRIPPLCSVLVPTAAGWGFAAAAHADPELVTNPAALVNPFVGTGTGGEHVGSVHTFPVDTFPGCGGRFRDQTTTCTALHRSPLRPDVCGSATRTALTSVRSL